MSDALGYLPCWAIVYPRSGGRFAGWVSETEVAGAGFIAVVLDGHAELFYPKDCWRITQATEADVRCVAQLPPSAELVAVDRYAESGWADEEQGRVFGAGSYQPQVAFTPEQAEQGSGG